MDGLSSHASECECNPAKLPEWMVSSNKEDQNSKTIPDDNEPCEGTTSLRMRLFKSGKADLMGSAATGGVNIFSMSSSAAAVTAVTGHGSRESKNLETMSDLTQDLVKSSDVISRNTQQTTHFIDISDDD